MKKLTLILTLLFSIVMLASPSYAEWTKVSETVNSNTFYVDFERIRKQDRYVYYWQLLDRLKPTEFGHLSSKSLFELDCTTPIKERSLSISYFTQPMGAGNADITDNTKGDWWFPPPESSGETILLQICAYMK